jgi:Ca2+-transporting ATPase
MIPTETVSWHSMEASEALKTLGSDSRQGLSDGEAARRLLEHGPNRLTARKGKGPLLRFLLQFRQPLIYILLASALITGILKEWVDSGVIFGVVLVNALIGFLQESKALNALAALARTMGSMAVVLRGGVKREVPAAELVPGDVVLLAGGDKVPADLRLLAVKELKVEEAALTGESVAVEKKAAPVEEGAVLADRVDMAYASTLVTYGTGTGVVTTTGDRTEVGRISRLLTETQSLETPLTRKIAGFSRLLLWAILGMAALTFGVGVLRGESALEMFMAAVALAVGAIPEGLPAAVTITLAIGVSRMARRRAIIRKLPAVETLGSTTIVCSDKTGTLTENQMTVQAVQAGGAAYDVQGAGYDPSGLFLSGGAPLVGDPPPALAECLRAGSLCNDSRLLRQDQGWRIQGDPTEGALLVSARKAGLDPEKEEKARPRLDVVAFESEHQYMAVLVGGPGDGAPTAYVKGAVERLLGMCGDALSASGERVPLDRDRMHRAMEEMASRGMRVLAFARRTMPGARSIGHGDIASGLTFLGLQGMIDPPRREAVEAVAVCRRAGIRVVMITGDHVVTAAAIAAQIGLSGDAAPRVMAGKDLEALDDAALDRVIGDASVFARVVPEQKLRLVKALQAGGHVVAMTGDGVNDAPALKRADIGVAMGITGTEVAKEAADMVLTDDNFSSIKAAIEEGRGVFDNLVKFITWTLPTNFGEGLVILAAILVGTQLPILPVQILWINMTTAVLLGLMLAFEAKEPGLMDRPPRDPRTPILTGTLLLRIGVVGVIMLAAAFGLFEWELARGRTLAEARTAAVNIFVFVEMFYLFNCRSLKRSMFHIGLWSNPWVYVGSAAMALLQLLFTYSPLMNRLFHSAPVDGTVWGWTMGAGLLAYLLIEAEKHWRGAPRPAGGR